MTVIGLASQGRYSAAINTASTIRWGRPLYYEARDAIARWDAELERLYAPPPPPSPESYYLETETTRATKLLESATAIANLLPSTAPYLSSGTRS